MDRSPIVILGQPRSGSTLITRLLNEVPCLLLINDFYVLQKIDAQDMWGSLRSEQARELAHLIFERIEIRALSEQGLTLSQSIELTPEQVADLALFVARDWPEGLSWDAVLTEVMSRAAALAGATRWGWNTPQDYLHLDRIIQAFPQAQMVFLLRDMAAVLASYKNVSGPWHEARRYNPLAIGLAWRRAATAYLDRRAKAPHGVLLVTYEALTRQQAETVQQLERFLQVKIPPVDLTTLGRNSSHDGGRPKLRVSGLELVLARAVMHRAEQDLSLRSSASDWSVRDIPETLRVMVTSGVFLVRSILFDRDRRRRVVRLIGIRR